MLKVADRLNMPYLIKETGTHIMELLSPSTVCLALSDPVVLNISLIERFIAPVSLVMSLRIGFKLGVI